MARDCLSLPLSMGVNEASHPIREENVDLARLDERRHFSLTECRMHHGLSATIRSALIVRRADLGR
jgi:hypothetical protein